MAFTVLGSLTHLRVLTAKLQLHETFLILALIVGFLVISVLNLKQCLSLIGLKHFKLLTKFRSCQINVSGENT